MSTNSNDDGRPERREEKRRHLRSFVWRIGTTLLLIVMPAALMHWIFNPATSPPLGDQTRDSDQTSRLKEEERQEFRSYVWGIGLALSLTLLPFALVHWSFDISRLWLLVVIGAFALAQMVVHFRFFLHIGFKQKREDLQLLLFSGLLLTIMVAGTIWIMASLSQRMTMPVSL